MSFFETRVVYSRRRESREYSSHPPLCVILSVCLSVRAIKPKRLKLKSPNLAQ